MLHDANREVLAVGDVVYIPCRVVVLHDNDKYINCTLSSILPTYPSGNASTFIANTKQIIKDPSNVSYDKTMLVTWGKDSL